MMNKTRQISIIVLLAFTVMDDVSGQTDKPVSLTECMELASKNSLTLRSGSMMVERAKSLQGTAFSIDKTDISLSQDPTSGGSPDNALTFSQSFEFPTVYGARRKLLKDETQLERNRLEVTRNELMREVAADYYNLLYMVERKRILEQQADIYKRFLFLANAKLDAGETGKLEQMNALRLSDENNIALKNAEKDVHIAQYRLQQWLNTDEKIMPAEDSLTVIDFISISPTEFNSAETPMMQMLEQQRKTAENSLNVTRQGYLPDISLAFSTQMLLKGFNPYDIERTRFDKGNFMGFEIGISVPLFFGGQRAKTKAAKQDVALAEMRMQEQMQRLVKQYKAAYDEYLKAKGNLDYYIAEGAAQADEIVRISQVSYENGAIGYIEYIQNLQTAVDIRNQYATAKNNYNQAVITLKYLQGGNK